MLTPDAVVWRWWELRGRLEAAPPQIGRWRGKLGIRPSPHCARCGADAVTWREDPCVALPSAPGEQLNGSADGSAHGTELDGLVLRSRCRRCHSAWLLELVPFLGGAQGANWTGDLAELLSIDRVLEALSEPQRRIYLQLYVVERWGDYEAVAQEASRRWPLLHPPVRASGPRMREWTRHSVRQVVLEGRERIVLGMTDAGLWRVNG